jgi:hypothetical protein
MVGRRARASYGEAVGVDWGGGELVPPTGVPCAAGVEEDGGEKMQLGRLELGVGSSRTARRC